MVDSVQVFDAGFRVLDANGNPVNGAKIKFRLAGPGATLDVYSDKNLSSSLGSTVYTRSDGFPVVSSGSNTTTLIYTGTSDYYVEITDANDVAIFPAKDNVRGALDTSTFLTSSSTSTLSIPVVSPVVDTTLTSTYRGKLINVDPTSGSITLTLDSAATLGDGWNCEIRNTGTANYVKITAGQNIAAPWGNKTAFALRNGESVIIRCNGSTFMAVGGLPAFYRSNSHVLMIVDIVSGAPVSPNPGDRYICSGAFTAGGVTTAIGDLIEATGQSTYIKVTPPSNCGWIAYVQSSNTFYSYQSTAWVAETGTTSRKGTVKVSDQSSMETGTAIDTAVLIGHQKYHPGHPKHWVTFNGSGGASVNGSFNNSSTARGGTGSYSTSFTTVFSGTGYSYVGVGRQTGTTANGDAGVFGVFNNTSKAAGTLAFLTWDGESDATIDSSEINIICAGDQ